MSLNHLSIISLLFAITLVCANFHGAAAIAQAQKSPATARETTARGIEMYKRGDVKESIKTLRTAVKLDKGDIDGWYYLGLAFVADNEIRDARQAFEAAVRLRPDFTDARAALAYMLLLEKKNNEAEREAEIVLNTDERNAEAHYVLGELRLNVDNGRTALAEADRAIAARPGFALAILLKAKAVRAIVSFEYPTATREQIAVLIDRSKEAVAMMDSMLKHDLNSAGTETWQQVLSVLRPYSEGDFRAFVYKTKDVAQKAKVVFKPSPIGPGAQGLVVLQMVLRWDGKVDAIKVLSKNDDGTARMCIEAARKIKFIPAIRDGRAVSQYLRVEYHFQ